MANHEQHADHDDHGHHGPGYIKVYWILLVLFIISVMGPEMAKWLDMGPTMAKITVLTTAFGIAFVKAYYVIAYFMHLKFELKYVQYMLATTIVFMLLFFSAVAPDVMRHDGACQRWGEENGQKVCKLYNWTNSAAAAEVVHKLGVQAAQSAGKAPKAGEQKLNSSQSDEWSSNGGWKSPSTSLAVRNKLIKEKAQGMHTSYWYDKQQYATNRVKEPAVLALKGKHMVAGLQRNYMPIEEAMKLVVADQARPMMLPSSDVFDPSAPTAEAWAKARTKAAELLSKPLEPAAIDPGLLAKGKDLFHGKTIAASGQALPCQGCHSVDGAKYSGPTLKGFYGRITTFKDATVARNDKTYFVNSIKNPDAQKSKDYPDGGMVNQVTDDEIEALYHYIASLK